MKRGKVLVTGSGGFSGRKVLEMLKERGYDVRATDLAVGERTATPDYYKKLGVEFIPSDLTDPKTLTKVVRDVEYILHPAALFDYSAPLEADRKINVEGTRNLCEAAIKAGLKRMILWSTIGVYGLQDEMPITEKTTPNPGCAYEISKLEQEEVVFQYVKDGAFEATAMRPAPVYGPENAYGFINLMKLFTFLPHVPIPTRLRSRLPSVHVKDVANAAIFLLEAPKNKINGEVFTMIDNSNLLFTDFQHLVAGLLGKETIAINFPMHTPTLMKLGKVGAHISRLIAENITHTRPLIEEATLNYVAYNDYFFSNEKIKSIGYEFLYPDVRVGLIEMIDWIKAEEMRPLRLYAS